MRLAELRGRVGFATKPRFEDIVIREMSRQQLQRNNTISDGVIGPPHLTHAPTTQQLGQAVAPKRRSVGVDQKPNPPLSRD